jgi:hypothetical protein
MLIVGGMALSVVLAGVRVPCQGAALIPLSRWRLRVSAAATTTTSVASVMGLGLLAKTLNAPLGLAAAIAALLGWSIADSA